jgi:hypothetical protein
VPFIISRIVLQNSNTIIGINRKEKEQKKFLK